MNHSNDIIQIVDQTLNDKKCHELCRKNKFIKRSSSKLKGHEFIKTMILPSEGLSEDSLKGLCKRIQQFNPEANITAQALCERINDTSSSRLMRAVYEELITCQYSKTIMRCPKLAAALGNFNSVLIEDSTMVTLNEKLRNEYKGTSRGRGIGAKSQVKIDLIYDIMNGLIVDSELYSGKVPDQSLAGKIIKFLNNKDLVIRDLGYFVLKTLKAIADQGAYFLSRLQPNVKIFLKEEDAHPLDLGSYIEKHYDCRSIIEVDVYLGEEKVPTRLIAYRQPKEIKDQRLREANKRAKATGRTMSKGKKLSLSFAFFVTNAPGKILHKDIVGTVYRLRWEIELVFKRWKGQLEIDYLKGINKKRIDCLIWSRLCSMVIVEMIRGYIAHIIYKNFERELSDARLIDYLLRNNILCASIAKHKMKSFLEEMENDIPRYLLKEKRARKTMRERVSLMESYYLIQEFDNQCVA